MEYTLLIMKIHNFLLNKLLQERLIALNEQLSERFLYVTIELQELYLVEKDSIISRYNVSTSRYGKGNKEGSFKTPLGIHKIKEKIGDGAPSGRIFRDRIDTGINWSANSKEENVILTRILRLEGLEEGVNRGYGIDSFERYIYIHGTSNEHLIGTPMSHGCICMKNNDIIELFDAIKEGSIVIIN